MNTPLNAFMIMPFGKEPNDAAYKIVKDACAAIGTSILRSDEIASTKALLDIITKAIESADLVFADISGLNPNVMYELGISHALKKHRTIIYTSDSYDNLPSDIRHLKIIKFEDSMSGATRFRQEIEELLGTLTKPSIELFFNRFDIYLKLLKDQQNRKKLYFLIALAHPEVQIGLQENISLQGGYDKIITSSIIQNPLKDFSVFFDLNLLAIRNEKFVLTDEGRAFVEYLETEGFKCTEINGKIISDDHISMFDLLKRKNKDVE